MHRTRSTVYLATAALAAMLPGCGTKMAPQTGSPASDGRGPRAQHDGGPAGDEAPSVASAAPSPPETGRLVGMTAAHNRARDALGIAPLSWSPELAQFAQRWADTLQRQGCRLRHRPRSGPDAQRYGENIFSATGSAPSAQQVVDSWLAEAAGYDARTGRCRGVCGHYTQVVWRKSARVGCGMTTCGDTEVWVCNYDPPGNFMGERPY